MRLLRAVLATPLLAIYACSDRAVVRLDGGRWAAIDRGVRGAFDSPPASIVDLLYIAAKYPEFRSVLYYRARTHNLAGKVLWRLANSVYKGAPGLIVGPGSAGPGLYIEHGHSSIISGRAIGRDCWINQNVTIANSRDFGGAVLGDRVFVRPGTVVLGHVTVGDDTEIGANSVVTRDLPSGVIAHGAPAKVQRANERLDSR